jgi:HPt (histidine-containing phosphotransfer) domain-containing protein
LLATLARWVQPRGAPDAATPQQPTPEWAASTAAYAVPGLEVGAALKRLKGNWPLLVTLLQRFSQQYTPLAGQLRAALARGDTKAAHRLAHTVSGAAATLALDGVFAAARDLETALLQDEQAGAVTHLVATLERELELALAAIARIPATEPPPAQARET